MFIGLDIGRQYLKFVILEKWKKGFRVLKSDQHLIPEQNRPFDPENINAPIRIMAIKELLKRNGIKPKRVRNLVTGICGTNASVKQITTMEMPSDELNSSMTFEARKHIPMDGTDAVIDYQVLGPSRTEVDKIDVALIACTKGVSNTHIDLLREVGMKPGIVDVDPIALINAFVYTHSLPDEGVVVLLDVGAISSSLIVWGIQDMFFTRDLPNGVHEMVKDISQRKSLDYLTAQSELYKLGVDAFEKPSDTEGMISVSERTALDNFVEDVRRTLRFYAKSTNQSHFTGIYLSGGGSGIIGLDKFIQNQLQMETVQFNPFSNLELKEELISENPAQFSVAVGLALRGCYEA